MDLQPENRQQMAPEVFNRFTEDTASKVRVKQISLPDLSVPLQLGRREPFSLFIPKHRKLAARLIDIFLGSFLRDFIFNTLILFAQFNRSITSWRYMFFVVLKNFVRLYEINF